MLQFSCLYFLDLSPTNLALDHCSSHTGLLIALPEHANQPPTSRIIDSLNHLPETSLLLEFPGDHTLRDPLISLHKKTNTLHFLFSLPSFPPSIDTILFICCLIPQLECNLHKVMIDFCLINDFICMT